MKILGDPTGSQSIDSEHFEQAFHVRGRHNILYDVDLPHSLPQDILEGMIDHFRYLVYKELYCLRDPLVTSSELDTRSPSFSPRYDPQLRSST
jgi:hypothetical protein